MQSTCYVWENQTHHLLSSTTRIKIALCFVLGLEQTKQSSCHALTVYSYTLFVVYHLKTTLDGPTDAKLETADLKKNREDGDLFNRARRIIWSAHFLHCILSNNFVGDSNPSKIYFIHRYLATRGIGAHQCSITSHYTTLWWYTRPTPFSLHPPRHL